MTAPSRIAVASLTAVLVLTAAAPARAYCDSSDPNVVCINPRMIRGGIGLDWRSIAGLPGSTPSRDAAGLSLHLGTPLVSAILRAAGATKADAGFELYDEFYLNMAMGALISDKLKYFADEESGFYVDFDFGFDVAAGWRFARYTPLGGMRFNWSAAFVGGSQQPGSSLLAGVYPLMVRFEWAWTDDLHLFASLWASAFGAAKAYGAELDIPVARRFWIAASVNTLLSDVELANADNGKYVDATGVTAIVALKFGPSY